MSVPAVGGTDPEGSRGYTYEDIQRIAQAILTRTRHRPVLGIICGSGLGGLADMVEDSDTIPYSEIKDFPVSTVPGHMGYLVFGTLSGKPVVLMRGRFHYYEGYPMWKVAMPVRVMKQMGVKTLFVTNAAGGINPDYKAGDMMIIKDHIDLPGLTGECVLIGKNDDRFGPRFPATVDIYDSKLRSMAAEIGKELGYGDYMREGVYIMIGGPTFETVAESRLLKLYGADAVADNLCGLVVERPPREWKVKGSIPDHVADNLCGLVVERPPGVWKVKGSILSHVADNLRGLVVECPHGEWKVKGSIPDHGADNLRGLVVERPPIEWKVDIPKDIK
ncbi:purine nucleoside phosphorylase-like isoform X1 [Haliotis cracherodii]|uniref:purine nucleoside phosphorylase-like isoform X1 n=1 Tax=Haliotis cracherodii TaxID=6455 RepID=UPI0039E92A0E